MTAASLFYLSEWVSQHNSLQRQKFERGDLEFFVQMHSLEVFVFQVEDNSILWLQKLQ